MLITLVSVAAGLYALSVAPWYLLPFVYIYMSAAVTGVSRGGLLKESWEG